MPMRRRSLRTRLAVLVTAIIAITLAVALTIAYGVADRRLDAQLNSGVRDQAEQLRQTLIAAHPATPEAALALTQRYAKALRLGRSSTLLFLLFPNDACASNYPALFDETTRWQPVSVPPRHAVLSYPHLGLHTFAVASVGSLRTDELAIQIAGLRAYAGAGESIATTRASEHQLLESFLIAGLAAMLLALVAVLALTRRLVAPITELATVATQVDGGDLTPRVELPDSVSDELRTLGDSFNHMLDRLTSAFDAQRAFVADASHELRTPLTVIRGQLDLLAHDEPSDPAEITRVRTLIDGEIARITRLVDDLLLLAQSDRDGFLRLARVSLPGLVTEIWDGCSLIAERNFELGRLDEVTIEADSDRLAQALRNLARNAIAHTTAPAGLVGVEILRPAPDHPDSVRIIVSDDGPGIPADQREEVFERFARLDPARARSSGGAGLGLAIVRAIVEAHNGTITVAERPGGGARFVLDLPINANSAGGPAGPPAPH